MIIGNMNGVEEKNDQDIVITGAIIGILADVVKLGVNYIMYLAGFTKVVFWQLVATRFLAKQYLFNPAAYFVGAVADITITASLGILFYIFIRLMGKRHLWIKAIGFAMFIWTVLFGTLLDQSIAEKLPQTASAVIVTIVAHFCYGLGLWFFTWRFLRKTPVDLP
ncbi:MAG TPA: hypothetical protein GXX29_13195 [Firmicutes bacterium]|nr:hypothetical protein [Bacillota bacterium]